MHEHISRHAVKIEGSSDRSFGMVFAAFFLLIAVFPLLHGNDVRFWAVGVSLIFGLIAFVFPPLLKPLNGFWTKFGLLLHSIVSPVALAILLYGTVTPIGVVMRLLGKDLLRLRFDREAASYWIKRTPPGPDAESLNNQF